MGAALKALLGPTAKGFYANTVSRLKSHLTGACKACCLEGAFGPENMKAGGMNLWMTINGSMSGRTAFTVVCVERRASFVPLFLLV